MDEFEALLARYQKIVERFVCFRMPSQADAEDVLQEVYLTAYEKFATLKSHEAFKPWLISIARNKCSDFFRKNAAQVEVPLDGDMENTLPDTRHGVSPLSAVWETVEQLGEKDRQILYLYFWKDMSQVQIAKLLNLPLGTVKSRLFTAKKNFKTQYPYPIHKSKGDCCMKKLPGMMPEYRIERLEVAPFRVKWEELMGWFLVPRLGEQLIWGMYDIPSRRCGRIFDMKVTGKAMVHGIEGVELIARESDAGGKEKDIHRTFVAQLTDTHCRYLATLRQDGDVKNYITFLDGDEFLPNWGFGVDNCGNETDLLPKGGICRSGNIVKTVDKGFLLDMVGRYTVTINGKIYDTVCVMDIETYNSGVVSEQFLDANGRTILWRRFERDDGQKWRGLFADHERLTVNGQSYVHLCDCITDYIL